MSINTKKPTILNVNNGILESKQWILNKDGSFEEHYDRFEESLNKLPRNDVNDYLTEKIIAFFMG